MLLNLARVTGTLTNSEIVVLFWVIPLPEVVLEVLPLLELLLLMSLGVELAFSCGDGLGEQDITAVQVDIINKLITSFFIIVLCFQQVLKVLLYIIN